MAIPAPIVQYILADDGPDVVPSRYIQASRSINEHAFSLPWRQNYSYVSPVAP